MSGTPFLKQKDEANSTSDTEKIFYSKTIKRGDLRYMRDFPVKRAIWAMILVQIEI